MPASPLWITPISLAVIVATGLHLQQAQLPSEAQTLAALAMGTVLAALGWRLRRHPLGLMVRPQPGAWGGALGLHLLVCAVMNPALGVGFLTWGIANWRAQAQLDERLPPEWEGRRVEVRGQVISLPQRTEHGWRFLVRVESAWPMNAPHQRLTLPSVMRVNLTAEKPTPAEATTYLLASDPAGTSVPQPEVLAPRVGEVWRWPLRLKAPHGFFNPHGDDAEGRAWAQGVSVWAQVIRRQDASPPERLLQADQAAVGSWLLKVEQWREQVRDRLHIAHARTRPTDATHMDHDLGVVVALLVGDQSAIGVQDWRLFRDTGIAHLMSISGLHITAWAWLCALMVRRLWRWADGRGWAWSEGWPAPHASASLGVFAALAYALFSGWGLPAQRTVLMLALAMGLRGAGLRWPWVTQWLTIAAVVVACEPMALMSPGFWLSFLAVAVLLSEGPLRAGPLVQAIRTQWRVSLLMLPLTWVFFGQLSWVAFIVNLWAIPWVSWLVLPLAVGSALVESVLPWTLVAIEGMRRVLLVMADWSWAVSSWPALTPWQATLAVTGTLVWVWRPWPWRWRILGLMGLLALVPWLSEKGEAPPWGELIVLVVDVGQGQAVILRTQHQTWLYDTGPGLPQGWNAAEHLVLPVLRAKGWPLDGLILSHADSDHVGGAFAVLQAFPELKWRGSIPSMHRLHSERMGQPCRKGQRWWVDGVRFEVLHPDQENETWSTNRQSCVLRVEAASGSLLLMGDLESRDEHRLVTHGAPLRADAIVVGHHGSQSSSSPEFVSAVKPKWAWVQSGYLNPHGHPHAVVVQAWRDVRAEVVATPECGAITWSSRHPESMQCERDKRRRFWHHRMASASGLSP